MPYLPIENYALIGNMHTAALKGQFRSRRTSEEAGLRPKAVKSISAISG